MPQVQQQYAQLRRDSYMMDRVLMGLVIQQYQIVKTLKMTFADLSHHRHLAKVVIARHSLDQDHRRSIAQPHQGIFDP